MLKKQKPTKAQINAIPIKPLPKKISSTTGKKPVSILKKSPKNTKTATRKKSPKTPDLQLQHRPFHIVGIGASAGGLEALEEFFTQMSPSTGLAFVVVPHQHPGHTSLLPGLIQKCTAMPVREAIDGLNIEPNTVTLALAGKNLAIFNTTLHLMDPDPQIRVPLPIDYFFRSLAEDQKHQAIGIILSGTGSDGTLGLKAIKGETGMTMAQEPQSAKFGGMPQSAIATGIIDYVCSTEEMPAQLVAYIKGPRLARPSTPPDKTLGTGEVVQKIFVLLRDRSGNDFSLYKTNTILRRIERRMNIHQIETAREYLRYLLANSHEIDALFQEMLIGVTSFFRDPLAFEALANKGLPLWLASKHNGASVRVWVTGCSTGEEVYSLAILLREYMTRQKVRFQVQIFGTDLDNQAIETARRGLYSEGIANDVTPERLERFFTKEDSHFRVKKDLRDLVTFARHNLHTDPPFTKLDLLSCRNLLIYLESHVQRRLIPLFHYAVNPNGGLFLGSSETTGENEHRLFEPLDRKWKLYTRKVGDSTQPTLQSFPTGRVYSMDELPSETPPSAPSISNLIETMLLGRYAPSSVIVNERGEVVYIHGRTGAFLEPASGQPNQLLLNMAREGLQYDLAWALQEASKQEKEVVRRGIRFKTNGTFGLVDVSVTRINDHEALRGLFLVNFVSPSDGPSSLPTKKKRSGSAPSGEPTTQVLTELQYTKQRLQHTIEELQTANEEMKSTNEELQSTNEELQSTNEELETSKEELQSLNEELLTVNAELLSKIEELDETQGDLHNLLNSIEVAVIFLDNDLNIKRFTPEMKHVINLIASDVGRPLADLVTKFHDDDFIEKAQRVVRTLAFCEHEVHTTEGRWYVRRIFPYRTEKNSIDGLVITFLDMTPVKEAEIRSREAQQYAENIIQTVREPLLVLNHELRVISTNQAFYQIFDLTAPMVIQKHLYEIANGQLNIPALRQLLEEVLPENQEFHDFRVTLDFPKQGQRDFLLNARRIEQEQNYQLEPFILVVFEKA